MEGCGIDPFDLPFPGLGETDDIQSISVNIEVIRCWLDNGDTL